MVPKQDAPRGKGGLYIADDLRIIVGLAVLAGQFPWT
jgi:hypothetical protein